jgi:hypothetical protein
MFRWYGNAVVCYTYLVDVKSGDNPAADASLFRKSRWFTRGWTLQELLAPPSLVFFNEVWEDIGTKKSLATIVSKITGIRDSDFRQGYLTHSDVDMARLKRISAAQKMFWASKRETTRVEDIAYCLMGLFDINMPMIYGEGHKAFERLQLAIINSSEDHSIFCWASSFISDGSPIALAPSDFRSSANIACIRVPTNSEYSMTNKGLKITLPLTHLHNRTFGVLNCYRLGQPDRQVVIRLQGEGANFARVASRELQFLTDGINCSKQSIYIQKSGPNPSEDRVPYPRETYTVLEFQRFSNVVSIYRDRKCIHLPQEDELVEVLGSEQLTRYTTSTTPHVSRLVLNKILTTYPVIIMLEEFVAQGHNSLISISRSVKRVTVLVGRSRNTLDRWWCDLLIPESSESGEEYAAKANWNKHIDEDQMDRQDGILADGSAVSIALKDIVVGGRSGCFLDIKSDTQFNPVLVGYACCWPNG